jgi:Tfp pilus assembly protein PilF
MSEHETTVTIEHTESTTRKERARRIVIELMVATFFQGTPQQARELVDMQLALDQSEQL